MAIPTIKLVDLTRLLVFSRREKTLMVPGTGHGASDPDDGIREENKDSPDWMGRTFGTTAAHVLSPSAAAYREKIFLLPGWMRALKPWGDVLQVLPGMLYRNSILVELSVGFHFVGWAFSPPVTFEVDIFYNNNGVVGACSAPIAPAWLHTVFIHS